MTTKTKTRPVGLAEFMPASAAAPAETPTNGAKSDNAVGAITVKVGKANKKRLKQLANLEDTTLQDLGVAGFNLILQSRGLPPLD